MFVRIVGVREIDADPKYDRIIYCTWEEYMEEFMDDTRFTAGNVWIDIPDEYNPHQTENGVILEFNGNKYPLASVLLYHGPDNEKDGPYLLFYDTDLYDDGDKITDYDTIFVPLKYCYDENEIDILKENGDE